MFIEGFFFLYSSTTESIGIEEDTVIFDQSSYDT